MRVLVLILMIFCALSEHALAFDRTEFYRLQNTDHYIVSYEESGVYRLDHFLVESNKLQVKIESKTFELISDLLRYKAEKYDNFIKSKSSSSPRMYAQTELRGQLWKVTETWSLEWEEKYAQWLEAEFNKDFFVKYNLKTDCADVAFALRWIFSRMNALPAANTLAGSGVLFTQESLKSSWTNLSTHQDWHQDQRFLAALNYLLENAYTGTLKKDAYPIELNESSFQVGTIHLDGGHAMIISEINRDSLYTKPPFKKLSSTVPAQVRVLMDQVMVDSSITEQMHGGLLRMRWPVFKNNRWLLTNKKEMPLYSLEQYSKEFRHIKDHFTLSLADKVGIEFKPEAIIVSSVNTIQESLELRAEIVEEGFRVCQKKNCSQGTDLYELHSTPSRDKRISEIYEETNNLVVQLTAFDPKINEKWIKLKNDNSFTVLGKVRSLQYWSDIFKLNMTSSHPERSLAERWAVDLTAAKNNINVKFDRLKLKREKLINQAHTCRQNQKCIRGSESWRKLNTYELDMKLKVEVLLAFNSLCQYFICGETLTSSEKNILTIAGFIAEPNASTEERKGEHLKNLPIMLPHGKDYLQIDDSRFIIDNRIFNLHTQVFNSYWSDFLDLTYSAHHEYLLGIKEKFLVYGKKGFQDKLEITKEQNTIFWINQSYFITTNCKPYRVFRETEEDQSCTLDLFLIDHLGPQKIESYIDIDGFNLKGMQDINPHELGPYGQLDFSISSDQTQKTIQFLFVGNEKIENVDTYVPEWRMHGFKALGVDYIKNEILLKNLKVATSCKIKFDGIQNLPVTGFYGNALTLYREGAQELYQITDNCELKLIVEGQSYFTFKHVENTSFITSYPDKELISISNEGVIKKYEIPKHHIPHIISSTLVSLSLMDSGNQRIISHWLLNPQTKTLTKASPYLLPNSCDTFWLCIQQSSELLALFMFEKKEMSTNYLYTVYKSNQPIFSSSQDVSDQEINHLYAAPRSIYLKEGTAAAIKNITYLYYRD